MTDIANETHPTEPPPSPYLLPTGGLRTLELLAALSGFLLAALFVSGRIYLATSLIPFHTRVADLGLPPQEVMFANWLIYLPLIFSAIVLAISFPYLRGLAQVSPQLTHIHDEATAIVDEADEITNELNQLIADGDEHEDMPEHLRQRIERLKRRSADLQPHTDTLSAQITRIEADMPLKQLPSVPRRYLILAIALLSVLTAVLWVWLAGWKGGLFEYSNGLLLVAISFAIFFSVLGITRAANASSRLAIGLVLLFVLVIPYPALSGLLTGLSSRYDSSPGHGFPKVTLWSTQQIQSDWQESGNWYQSPTLRLIADRSDRLTLWNPADPGSSIQIPTASITLLQRR